MKKTIGYLGKNNEHLFSLTTALSSFEVSVVPIEMSQSMQNGNKLRHVVRKVISKFFGTNDVEFSDAANKLIVENKLDVIITYWGANIIPDLIAIKKTNHTVKIVLNVMCHPMGLSPVSVLLQNLYMKYAAKYIDGFVFSSSIMRDYFKDKILPNTNISNIIVPTLLSRSEFPNQFLPPCSHQPNLLFLGRPDWWNGQPTDNLNDQLLNAIRSGIHVYHAGDPTIGEVEEKRHTFGYMGFSELKIFATQFDVSLIMYNLDMAKNLDRFNNTIPDRLIASVAFGIPIAIPKKGYAAVKEFLKDYEAVVVFDDFEELHTILSNRKYVEELKIMAKKNSIKYSLESFVPQLWSLFWPNNAVEREL